MPDINVLLTGEREKRIVEVQVSSEIVLIAGGCGCFVPQRACERA